MKCDELYAAGLISFAVLFTGCTSSSVSVSDVSQSPEEYVGQTLKLTGQIAKKEPEYSFLQRFDVSNQSLNESLQAVTASKRIGTLDGSIELTGSCRQNTYASEVKVEGQVKSYSSCDCEGSITDIEENELTMGFLLLGDKVVNYTTISGLGIDRVLNEKFMNQLGVSKSSIQSIDSKADFRKIDKQISDNLTRKLDLENIFEDRRLSEAYFDETGKVAPQGIVNTRSEKYQLGNERFKIDNFKLANSSKTVEQKTSSEVPSFACKRGREYIRSTDEGEYRKYAVEGCSSEPEEKYYFSCDNVVEQIN
jgi:hypothetical protein